VRDLSESPLLALWFLLALLQGYQIEFDRTSCGVNQSWSMFFLRLSGRWGLRGLWRLFEILRHVHVSCCLRDRCLFISHQIA